MNVEKLFSSHVGWIILFFLVSILCKDSLFASAFMVIMAVGVFLPSVIKHISIYSKGMIILAIVLSLSFIISTLLNGSLFQYTLKFISYIIIFLFGYLLCYRNVKFDCNNYILKLAIFIPVLCYIFIYHRKDGGLFDLANTYVYYGLSMAIFYYLMKHNEKNSIRNTYFIFIVYVLSATKLGIIFAVVLVYLLYSLDNPKRILNFISLFIIGIIAIFTIDLPVFLRIRDVYELATNIPLNVYTDISNTSAYEIGQLYGKGNDDNDTSFVFRLVHWSKLLNIWSSSSIIHILFGYGDMYVKNNYTLQPHNEYIKFLFENGLIVFSGILLFVYKSFIRLKRLNMRYLLLTPFMFLLTENLVYFSCMNFYIFLSLGYFYCKQSVVNKSVS